MTDLPSDHLKKEDSSTLDTGSYSITNPDDASIINVPPPDVEGRDVLINDLQPKDNSDKIIVKILGNPGTLHATNMKNVVLLCGPVRTSIFIENCQDCEFVVACQQLRIHTTTHSHFYLHVTSKVSKCKNCLHIEPGVVFKTKNFRFFSNIIFIHRE